MELSEKFNLVSALAASDVKQKGMYTFDEIFDAVKKSIGGKNPGVECHYDHDAKRVTLAQIDVCLTKDLQVMDCDRIHGGLNHGCPAKGRAIWYPDSRMYDDLGSKWWISEFFLACLYEHRGKLNSYFRRFEI